MNYSIQLYSVRDAAGVDFEGTVAKMAEIGYKEVEFAGFYDRSAEQIKALLDQNGLTVSGSHSALQPLIDDFEGTVAYHKTIGNTRYIIPHHDLGNQEKLDAFVKVANPLCERLAAEGITLGYHNHAAEFLPNADGSHIYDQLLYRTNLKFEVDTFWAYIGVREPLKVLDRVGDRLCAVHIKDGIRDGNYGKGKPLGMGESPVAAVLDRVMGAGVPLVVESETCTPDGPTEAKICFDYLASYGK